MRIVSRDRDREEKGRNAKRKSESQLAAGACWGTLVRIRQYLWMIKDIHTAPLLQVN